MRHGLMIDRDRTTIQNKLHRDGVTLDEISEVSGVSRTTVHRCLDLKRFMKVKYGDLFSVRSAIEALTYGETRDWSEYDHRINCLTHEDVLAALV